MVKFEDIQKANATIITSNIQGKEYAEVNQRIKAFRMVYPEGFIKTEMVSNDGGVCIFRAEVGYNMVLDINNNLILKPVVIGSGTAYEKENSTFINKTSYIENCETSAVGRALGMAGFGIDTSVASAEEVKNAIANQNKDGKKAEPKKAETKKEEPKKASEINTDYSLMRDQEKYDKLEYFTQILNGKLDKVLLAFGKTDVYDLSMEDIDKAIAMQKAGIDKARARKEQANGNENA